MSEVHAGGERPIRGTATPDNLTASNEGELTAMMKRQLELVHFQLGRKIRHERREADLTMPHVW
jgi:hypothetical protein